MASLENVVQQVAKRSGLTQRETKEAIIQTLKVIEELTAEGERVVIQGFGSFYTKVREAREGVKPGTKEKVQYPASSKLAFKRSARA